MVFATDFADAEARAGALAERTSFRIGGVPEWLFEPATEEEAGEVVRACRRRGVPLRVLGGGCNLLVADGRLEGAVVATRRLRFEHVHADRVEVGAGSSFPRLVRRSAELGIPRLSGCPGIPGSVGGVVAMNAGGRFGCVGDALLEVRGFDADGTAFTRRVREGDLGYRTSVFDGTLVTAAAFVRDDGLDRAAARRLFDEATAWKRATQPLADASAGCVFRNPAGTSSPSAGALIDRLGLKGGRVGGALVSPVHANFIVNAGGATFAEVESLIELVRRRVREGSGHDLHLEVKVWR
jgi:UDP-N-acetylmuramate dehydrogenase